MIRWRQLALLVFALAAMTAFPACANAQDEFATDAARLVTALKLGAGQTVADIGAGRGELTVALAREVGPSGRIYATELDSARLRDIRQAADAAGLKNVSVGDAPTFGLAARRQPWFTGASRRERSAQPPASAGAH
ncbi:MAG: methyltransferase domain-containing protein [Gemmatimonadales bacterium]|nr:methyltransferase domain-containing protein [Gemmatimonadales bacterium]